MADDLPTVRSALPSEEAEIMAMCRALHAENGLFSFCEDKVRDCLKRCYERKGGIVGVIGETGKLEASIGIVISEFYYTDQWHLSELWAHVLPAYRKSRNAEALIAFAKNCSKSIGIPLLIGIISNKRLAAKARLYSKYLGCPAGVWFVHNAEWQQESRPDYESIYPLIKQTRARAKKAEASMSESR